MFRFTVGVFILISFTLLGFVAGVLFDTGAPSLAVVQHHPDVSAPAPGVRGDDGGGETVSTVAPASTMGPADDVTAPSSGVVLHEEVIEEGGLNDRVLAVVAIVPRVWRSVTNTVESVAEYIDSVIAPPEAGVVSSVQAAIDRVSHYERNVAVQEELHLGLYYYGAPSAEALQDLRDQDFQASSYADLARQVYRYRYDHKFAGYQDWAQFFEEE